MSADSSGYYNGKMRFQHSHEFCETSRAHVLQVDAVSSRMFQDIKTSDDLNAKMKQELGCGDMLNVKILSAGAWVKGVTNFPIQLPHEVEDNIPKIVEHYNTVHSGRKLNFHPLLSHGSLLFKSKLGSNSALNI